MHAAETGPAEPVAPFVDESTERQFLLRIPCTCSPVAHASGGEECSLCRGERERLLIVPEASLKADHIELLAPRDRVAALRSLCVRGDWQQARGECLRIALARGDEARRRVEEEHGGSPIPLRSVVNAALEMAAWRALAHYCRELGSAP